MGFTESVAELYRDVVFGNGFIALAIFVGLAITVTVAKLTRGGQL